MNFLRRFLSNHVLANLAFGLVIVLGTLSYLQMPRAKDPEIKFNWVNIISIYPGASAADIERRITDPIEDALRSTVRDMKYVLSTSRDNISNILVWFKQVDDATFSQRLVDLRREVQNTYVDEFPEEAEEPVVQELSTSSSFPSAIVVVTSPGDDENLRRQANSVKKDLERLSGVDGVAATGLADPELHIRFIPERLEGLGITPVDISETIRAYFRDTTAGDLETSDGTWIVRLTGTSPDPAVMQDFPVVTASGVVPLGEIAELVRTREERSTLVTFRGNPAVTLNIAKHADTNILELIDNLNEYLEQRNRLKAATGVKLFLADDQTVSTRQALALMQTNALVGLFLVLLVTWVFLGTRIAFMTSIGILFTLAGTFLVLNASNFTLNNSVLLGVVVVLGMIVDDAVVVVEAVYYRLQRGVDAMASVIGSFREVFAPVTTSVMTTIAVFLPLALLPGVVGDFMRVVPIVVTVALLISLVEAYWILPSHVLGMKPDFANAGAIQSKRKAANHRLRLYYTRVLVKSLRYPVVTLILVVLLIALALGALASGRIQYNFLQFDPVRMFNLNIELPQGASVEDTSRFLVETEAEVLKKFLPGELRSSVTFAGIQLTETQPFYGDTLGQIMFSLHPRAHGGRAVSVIADAVLQRVENMPGPIAVSLLEMTGGLPASKAVSVKVLGSEYPAMLQAAAELRDFLERQQVYENITLDYRPGNPELALRLDGEAVQRAGLNPATVARTVQTYVDGEIVAVFQDAGEEIKVRVVSKKDSDSTIDNLMRQTISLPDGRSIALEELVVSTPGRGAQNILHYNFRRAITLESDIDTGQINTLQANSLIRDKWRAIQAGYPDVSIDFSGELDDITESLDAIGLLLLLGLGAIYVILGTQFRSYFQPFLVITTVPLAFTGVTLGLLVTGNPLSLFTLYGGGGVVGHCGQCRHRVDLGSQHSPGTGHEPVACDGICRAQAGCARFYHLVDHHCGIVFTGRRARRKITGLGSRGYRDRVGAGDFNHPDITGYPPAVSYLHGIQRKGREKLSPLQTHP